MYTAIANYSGLFVCSAGNAYSDNDTTPHYPSNYDLDIIISVGASTIDDLKRESSNYGDLSVDIFAPGQNIFSTLPGGLYGEKKWNIYGCSVCNGCCCFDVI